MPSPAVVCMFKAAGAVIHIEKVGTWRILGEAILLECQAAMAAYSIHFTIIDH